MDLKDLHIPDSPDPRKELDEFSFFIENGRYFTEEIRGKKKVKIDLSNFVMKSVFHLLNGTNNSQRIIYLQRYTGKDTDSHLVEVFSSELKPEAFETILKSKRCTFYGQSYYLKKIFAKLMDSEIEATILQLLGWNSEHELYVFADAIYDGELYTIDNLGIIKAKNKQYYLPAYGFANIKNEDWQLERKYKFRAGMTNFKTWADLYYKAYGNNGAIGIMYALLAAFRDIVFEDVGFFPFLFLFGDFGTGKTQFTSNLLYLFGDDVIGMPLKNATIVAYSRQVSSRCNSLVYFKEYTADTDEYAEDFILTAYDGAGRTTGIKSNDNKTKSYPVRSGIIFDGNHLPTQKTAILSRMILLNFEDSKFTLNETEAFNKLKVLAVHGFGNVLLEILRNRDQVKKNLRSSFLDAAQKIRKKDYSLPERTINHLSLMYALFDVLRTSLIFPFNEELIKKTLLENAMDQNQLLKESGAIHVFWESFSNGISRGELHEFNKELNNQKNCHFRIVNIEGSEKDIILQLRYRETYPFYVRYCKNNNIRFLDKNSLLKLLTSTANTSFRKTEQKGRGRGYTDITFGFCYQFSASMVEKRVFINEIEINL